MRVVLAQHVAYPVLSLSSDPIIIFIARFYPTKVQEGRYLLQLWLLPTNLGRPDIHPP